MAGAVALGLAFVPLFDVLGFEFSVTLGAVLAYVAGWRAAGAAARARTVHPHGTGEFPGAALGRCLAGNLGLLVLPLLVMCGNALRVPNCNWGEGLAFYLVFGVPGLAYGSALGFLFGLVWERGKARLAFIVWSLGTIAYALWNVLWQPPIFAFNAFIGYFPGPLYDRAVSLSPTLLVARTLVLLQAACFFCLAYLGWGAGRWRLRQVGRDWNGGRAVAGIVGLVVLAPWCIAQTQSATLGLRLDRQTIQRTLGGHVETEHCHIYYATDAYSPAEAAELAREHEFHFAELSEWFGLQPHRKIRSYIYANAAQKKRLMGAAGTNFEDALHDEFHINAASFPHPVLRHEMAHIFAAQIDRWRPICWLIGIHEGVAVAAEWREESARVGLTPDEACVAMDSLGVLPRVQDVLSAFGFWTQSSSRAYTAAGAFVHFLVETRGMQRFRRLWSSRDFEKSYGSNLQALLDEWRRQRLEPIHLTPAQLRIGERLYRRRAVFQEPCAHEQARLRQEAYQALRSRRAQEAESLFARLREIAPTPDVEADLVRARLLQGAATGALELAESLRMRLCAEHQESDCGRAWRDEGDALWHLERFASAESCYARAAALSGDRNEHRSLVVCIAVLRHERLRLLLRDYLTGTAQSDVTSLALLSKAVTDAPDSPLPRYLLGRRLYFSAAFQEAVTELEAVLEAPRLEPDVRLAAVELLAWSQLRRGRPEAVEPLLQRLDPATLSTAERFLLDELQHRASWLLESRNAGTFSAWARIQL